MLELFGHGTDIEENSVVVFSSLVPFDSTSVKFATRETVIVRLNCVPELLKSTAKEKCGDESDTFKKYRKINIHVHV